MVREIVAFLIGVTLVWVIIGVALVWVIVRVTTSGLKEESESSRRELRRLSDRLTFLENFLKRVKVVPVTFEKGTPARAAPPPAPVSESTEEKVSAAPKIPEAPKIPPSPAMPPPPAAKPEPPGASMPERKVVQKETPPTAAFRTKAASPVAAIPRRSGSAGGWADLEERVGANWLNRIGTVVLVIGMALFLNYSMQYLGKGGRVAVAYLLGAALLTLGVVGERRDRYRIISRALVGGGWATLYATTYAVHHVEAVKLIESSALGFALLFSVAAAMVIHSLRYDSELITGFAYGLGVASMVVSRPTAGTVIASVVLAVALVILFWRRRWYRLEPGAVAVAYGVHAYWLWQIYDSEGGKRLFDEYQLSVVLLTTLWMIFIVSHFLRPEGNLGARRMLTYSFLLNAGGYLAVMRYQLFSPDSHFWFLLGCGVAYLALSAFARKRTRQLRGIIYERPEDQCRRRPRGLSIRRTFTVSSKAPATSFMLGVEPSRFLRQSLFMLWHLASPFTDAQTRHERC